MNMENERQRKIEQLSCSKEEEMLGKRIIDLDGICQKRHTEVYTQFLTEEEQTYCEMLLHMINSKCIMTGGYDNAQRKVVMLLPDEYYTDYDIPFAPLKIKHKENVGHRDILGSILGLGIERNILGDILVGKIESYVFVMKTMADYIVQSLLKIGRQQVEVSIVDISEVVFPEVKTEEINTTVASLRIDCIVAEGFRLSRENAKEAIKRQLVQINHKIIDSSSHNVKEKDVISLRGKGKIILECVSGTSKKDRIWIKILKYI